MEQADASNISAYSDLQDEQKATTIQTQESYRAERLVCLYRIFVGALILIALFFIRNTLAPQSAMAVLISATMLIIHSAVVVIAFKVMQTSVRMQYLKTTQYISSVVDILIGSIVLWLFGAPDTFKSNAFLVYIVFVALAAFRYSRPLVLFTGILATITYLAMFAYALLVGAITLGTLSEAYTTSAVSLVSIANKVGALLLVSILLGKTTRGYSRVMRRFIQVEKISRQQHQRANDMRNIFRRYFADDIADHIWNNRQKLFSERREVTIMFCDFRNFTALSDRLPTEHVVAILNSYLSELVEAVFLYGGTLDKYTGDGFMAVFGAPLSKGNDPHNALCVAAEIKNRVLELNARHHASLPNGLKVGIGINTGEAIVGNIGSEKRVEYTVIGSAVNIAARLESLNKKLDSSVLISESTYRATRNLVQAKYRGLFEIRGIQEPVRVYELLEVPQVNSTLEKVEALIG